MRIEDEARGEEGAASTHAMPCHALDAMRPRPWLNSSRPLACRATRKGAPTSPRLGTREWPAQTKDHSLQAGTIHAPSPLAEGPHLPLSNPGEVKSATRCGAPFLGPF